MNIKEITKLLEENGWYQVAQRGNRRHIEQHFQAGGVEINPTISKIKGGKNG